MGGRGYIGLLGEPTFTEKVIVAVDGLGFGGEFLVRVIAAHIPLCPIDQYPKLDRNTYIVEYIRCGAQHAGRA
jgi:hypothetical protein